uniref:Pectinesterase 3-like n=1 Tax=Rhizophora mucronata TaxID=61149 RepID=A0A2P2K5R6_RHIMU
MLAVPSAEMLEKQEVGYRVTPQTALREADGVNSGGAGSLELLSLLFRLCTTIPTTAPMIAANKRMEETMRMMARLRVLRRNARSSASSTLP